MLSFSFSDPLEELLPALQLLDGLLERSLQMVESARNETAKLTELGSQDTVVQAQIELAIPPAYPRYRPAQSTDLPSSQITQNSRLGMLQEQFGLSMFDVDVLLIAIATELDRRYEKIYAYLQNDARCCRPSVDLALDLLSDNAAEKLQLRSHFTPTAPLLRHKLIQLVDPPQQHHPSPLAQELILDAAIVRYLLDEGGLAQDLHMSCSLTMPTTATVAAVEDQQAVWTEQIQALMSCAFVKTSLRLYLQSLDPVATAQFAQTLAKQMQLPLLMADLGKLAREPEHFPRRLQQLIRDSWLQQVLLYMHPVEALMKETTAYLYPLLLESLADVDIPIILAGCHPWQPSDKASVGITTLVLPTPDAAERCVCWQAQLARYDLKVKEETVIALADRFRLTPTQIENAISTAHNHLIYQLEPLSTEAALFKAARNQSGYQLAKLAQVIHPRYSWDDLVLPKGPKTQLNEICLHMQHRHRVLQTWGFDRKLSLGKGINALFAGPPGTGKTMAAEVIARSLQLDLYRIDLSQVVSKYIGETEKNLSQIFTAAASSNAILLFDEADALFGKRTEVKDSHDRYANLEVSYLLQQMEAYEGLAILTTNLKANLDEAFVRRLRFIVDFPLPSIDERRNLWQRVWPKETPLDSAINWEVITDFELTGGNIRNIALSAAFLAANSTGQVKFEHIKQSIRREYQKMGKILMGNMFK